MSRGPLIRTSLETVPACHNKMFCAECDKTVVRLFYTKFWRRSAHTYHVCSECNTVYVRDSSGKYYSRNYKLEMIPKIYGEVNAIR